METQTQPQVQETKKKSKILNYINVFRGLAILLIIMGHTMQFQGSNIILQKANIEFICGGTALFIFISGFLFQHLSYKFEYKNYLSKKWSNVVLPYLVTSIPGIILCFNLPLVYGNSFDGLPKYLQIPMMLSVGRVHNVPSWFILMIIIFFILSSLLLYLEKKNILYKLLPLFFILTIVFNRHDVDYDSVMGLSYTDKYIEYVNYILLGFVHFLSMYVFGMMCSKYKEIIDVFYNKRFIFWGLFILASVLNIYSSIHFDYTNGTISKVFMTILLLAYLKHYDNWLISHEKLNKGLDILAKYSFGLFFVHWYIFFMFNQIFHLDKVLPYEGIKTFGVLGLRCLFVTVVSLLILWIIKTVLLKINPDFKTRSVTGV